MTDPFIDQIVGVYTVGYAGADDTASAKLDAQREELIQRLSALRPLAMTAWEKVGTVALTAVVALVIALAMFGAVLQLASVLSGWMVTR